MELETKIFAILAILCVLCSACSVYAADDASAMSTDDGIFIDGSGHDGHDGEIIPPDNTHDEEKHAAGMDPYLDGSQDGHNGTVIPPDASHNEAAMNQTNSTHAAGSNDVTNATGNTTNNTIAHNALPATGNPILALLAIAAVLSGATYITRKK